MKEKEKSVLKRQADFIRKKETFFLISQINLILIHDNISVFAFVSLFLVKQKHFHESFIYIISSFSFSNFFSFYFFHQDT